MAETGGERRLRARTIFAGLFALLVVLRLLPLGTGAWPWPDLTLAVTLAWALRRPDALGPLLLGALWLMADLLLMRPPGLEAALVVLLAELLRRRGAHAATLSPPAEMAVVTAAVAGLVFARWGVLSLALVAQPGLGAQLLQAALTVAAYPAAALAARALLGRAERRREARTPGRTGGRIGGRAAARTSGPAPGRATARSGPAGGRLAR